MAEERWHSFAKEKPGEDMEGRNFIVSNGHYEKIATWCGYWENEPFMGDRLCDEVARWKFYFTPEEEKANEATRTELKAYNVVASSETENYINGETNLAFEAYDADEVDALLAEKDKDISNLKEELSYIKKLEDAKATHYAEMVDAGMRERRLRRLLWQVRTHAARYATMFWKQKGILNGPLYFTIDCRCYEHGMKEQTLRPSEWAKIWSEVERKCRAKAKEFGG